MTNNERDRQGGNVSQPDKQINRQKWQYFLDTQYEGRKGWI